jgi:hypothetical protein
VKAFIGATLSAVTDLPVEPDTAMPLMPVNATTGQPA